MTIDELLNHLWHKVRKLGSQKALAAELGVSAQYLNDVLRKRREPGESILKPLGLKRVVRYEKDQ